MNQRGAALVVSSGMASDIAATRSLGKRGIPVITLGFNQNEPVHHSKYVTESFIIEDPACDYDQFVASVLDIAERDDVHTMVPLNGFGIHSIMENRNEFEQHLALPLVDPQQYEKVRDRKQLFEIASSVGISVPDALSVEEANSLDGPIIAKPRYTISMQNNTLQYPGVRILDENISESSLTEEMGRTPLLQKYVENGSEYGYFAVFDRGEPIAQFQHRRRRSTSYSGGASVYREATYVPEIESIGEKLLKALNWHGPAMVELRRDDVTGEFYLMEINPRFWGSLILGIKAGVDFPYIYYRLSKGEHEPNQDYDRDVTASYLRGEIQHLYSVAFEANKRHIDKPSIIKTLFRQFITIPEAKHDVFNVKDPLPFFYDFIYSVKRYFEIKRDGGNVLP